MRKPIYFLLLVLPLLTPVFSVAQQACGTDVIHRKLLLEDADYRNRLKEKEVLIQQYLQKVSSRSVMSANDTIPVVVHVLHTGQAVGSGYNISDAQIQSSIDRVNQAFADYDGVGTDSNIRFALATRAPDGCSTTNGINRIDASGTNDYENVGISTTTSRLDLFNLSRWNTEEYLNFWVVSEIDGNNGGSGTQGFATFSSTSHQYDGVVCMYNTTGYDPTGALGYNLKSTANQNETVIHEFGHYLDLYHTFQGDDGNGDGSADQCPTETNGCGTTGDCCSDTDPHQRTGSNVCWTGVTNSCTGSNYGDVVKNYMAYSSQDCKVQFTADQVARMQATLSTSRTGLLNGWAFAAVETGITSTSSCEPTILDLTNSYGLGIKEITVNGQTVSSGGAVDDGGNISRECVRFQLSAGVTYTFNVKNNSSNNEHVFIYIDFNNDGDFDPTGEGPFYSLNKNEHDLDITMPSSPLYNTPMRIRILSDNAANSGYNYGCQDLNYGQAEDYAVYFESSAELTASTSALDHFQILDDNASAHQTFTVSGDDLHGNATLNLSNTDFEISSNGSTYTNTLTLTESGGNLQGEPVTLYARLKAGLALGDYTDSISIASEYADTVWVNLSGRVTTIDAERGNALSLDGANDYVYSAMQLPDTYTKEAWVKRASTGSGVSYNIISTGSTAISHVLYASNNQSNKLSGGHNGSWNLVQDSEALPTGEWVHVALSYDATTQVMKLYKNGLLVDEASSVPLHITSDIGIGTYRGGNNCWEGMIDEVRIWNVVRTEEEIREMMHLTLSGTETGLAAYFQFNESSGSVAEEKMGAADGTLNGDATFSTSTLDVGTGTCTTVTLGSTGTSAIEVNSNDLQIDFADGSTAPNGDLMIFKLDGSPANSFGENYEFVNHWVVRNFGANTTGLDVESIKFTLPTSDPVFTYHTNTMSLYKRDSGSDGSWTNFATEATSIDYTNGIICFDNLSSFTSFSQIGGGSNGAALPVELKSFQAQRLSSNTVQLTWTTSSEDNNMGFEIMRSYTGKNFEAIFFTPGKGTTSATTNYEKQLPETRAAYYRLRQVDLDGQEESSAIRYVDGAETSNAFTVFPNPSKGDIQIRSTNHQEDDQLRFSLIGIDGKVILKIRGDLMQINLMLSQQITNLPNGMYWVQLNDGITNYKELLMIDKN